MNSPVPVKSVWFLSNSHFLLTFSISQTSNEGDRIRVSWRSELVQSFYSWINTSFWMLLVIVCLVVKSPLYALKFELYNSFKLENCQRLKFRGNTFWQRYPPRNIRPFYFPSPEIIEVKFRYRQTARQTPYTGGDGFFLR